MFSTLLKFAGTGIKNILHIQNVPIIGDILEEKASKDGGQGQFQQINVIRLIRKIVRVILILFAAYLIMKGDDEKADKIQELEKKIYFVNFDNMAQRYIHQFLDDIGTGLGTFSAVGSFTPANPLIIKITPPEGQFYVLYRMIISINDKPIQGDRYGNQLALTNGIEVRTTNKAGDITNKIIGPNPLPIKTTADWGRQCYDFRFISGGMMDTALFRWSFTNAISKRMIMGRQYEGLYLTSEEIGAEANNFEVVIQDDLQGLDNHLFLVEGEWGQIKSKDYKYV